MPAQTIALTITVPPPEFSTECKVAKQDSIPTDAVYLVAGTYIADGHHGSGLQIWGCDQAIHARFVGDAANAISKLHVDFKTKCGGDVMSDHISGVFAGSFVRGEASVDGPALGKANIFVINSIGSSDLDIASVSCPK